MSEKDLLDYIDSYIEYDRNNGRLFWKAPPSKYLPHLVGKECGKVEQKSDYMRVKIKNKSYMYHHIIFLIENKRFPKDQIDHINGVRGDNRILNLRETTMRGNCLNKKCHREGRLAGAQVTPYGKFQSHINISGKRIHLACFESEEEAHLTYLMAREFYGV